MAGTRLEHWSTLNKADLQERVDTELRQSNLSFAEQQLLDAALERLKRWKEPHKRGSSMDDPKPTPEPEKEPPEEDSKMKRTASKVRAGKKRGNNKPTATRKSATRSRIDEAAKVTKTGKANGFREGSDSWKRTEAVLKSSGQTVANIKSKHGKLLKSTTLANLRKLGYIKIG